MLENLSVAGVQVGGIGVKRDFQRFDDPDRIFDAFMTTKRRHSDRLGRVTFHRRMSRRSSLGREQPDRGARFSVVLPPRPVTKSPWRRTLARFNPGFRSARRFWQIVGARYGLIALYS